MGAQVAPNKGSITPELAYQTFFRGGANVEQKKTAAVTKEVQAIAVEQMKVAEMTAMEVTKRPGAIQMNDPVTGIDGMQLGGDIGTIPVYDKPATQTASNDILGLTPKTWAWVGGSILLLIILIAVAVAASKGKKSV